MEMIAATCKGFAKYELSDISETLRYSGGDVGGGTETLVINILPNGKENNRGIFFSNENR